MGTPKIRYARPEDLEFIEQIFRSHGSDHDWRYAELYFRGYFEHPERRAKDRVLVCVTGGRIVGVIGYLQDEYETDDVFWLGWFYVQKGERPRHHARLLLDRVVKDLAKQGGRRLYTDTSSWRFYEREHRRYKDYGFRKEGRLKDYYEKGEHRIIYGKKLK